MLSTTIAGAIERFSNLSRITLCPITFHETLFKESLSLLPKLVHLRELAVNSSCMESETAPLLTRIEGLRRLTLHSPGRTILDSLPEWLSRLSPTLTGLHLRVSWQITPREFSFLIFPRYTG